MQCKELYNNIKKYTPQSLDELNQGISLIQKSLLKSKLYIDNIPFKDLPDDTHELKDTACSIEVVLNLIRELNIKIDDQINGLTYEENKIDDSIQDDRIYLNEFVKKDFSGTKPIQFTLLSETREVKSWKDLFFGVCEILNKFDEKIFLQFIHNPKFQGKSRWYFSMQEEELSTPEAIPNSNVYAEKNLTANIIRNVVAEMLQYYYVTDKDFCIILRNKNITKRRTKKQIKNENSSPDLSKFIVDTMRPVNPKKAYIKPDYRNKKLDEMMGTKSHIGFVKMEEDHKRTKNKCVFFNKEMGVCSCNKSPYYNIHCGNISHCDYYNENNDISENRAEHNKGYKDINPKKISPVNDKVYLLEDDKWDSTKTCSKCFGKLEKKYIKVFDRTENRNCYLKGYVCKNCKMQFARRADIDDLLLGKENHVLSCKFF